MFLHPKTGRRVVTADEAAEIIGCGPSNIRHWGSTGELTKIVESPRRVYYYLDEIEKRSRDATATKKKRGGRPRKGDSAA